MGGGTFPLAVAAWCAGALVVECCGVVALARDQHAAARCVRRAIAVCAAALGLAVSGLVARGPLAAARVVTTGALGPDASSILLVAGWVVAALTIIEVGRGIAFAAGRSQPMRHHASRTGGPPLAGEHLRASWLLAPALRSFGSLGLAIAALILVLRTETVNRTLAHGRAVAVMVLFVDVALAVIAASLWRGFSRYARDVLVVAVVLTCLQLAYMLLGGPPR